MFKSVPIPIYTGDGVLPDEEDWRLEYWKFEDGELWGLLLRDDPTYMRYYRDTYTNPRTDDIWVFHASKYPIYARGEDLEKALKALDIWV